MLSISHLSVNYGAIRALQGLSLTAEKGQIVTLIGANGAGKSSTLRAISGLTPASGGTITWEGREITRLSADKIMRSGICHSPEGRRVFANMSVRENLEMGAYARSDASEIKKDFAQALALFPRLRERLMQNAGTLSGGEQQMLAIGRALMGRPRLLLLDEPSLGLAPFLVRDIFKIILEINKLGVTVLLVEQNAHMALSIAHYAYVLQSGSIALAGPPDEIAGNPLVKAAYLGD